MRATFFIKILLTVLLLTQTAVLVNAQNSKEEKYYTNNDRHWLVEIPLWVPGFRGQLSYGDFDLSSSGNQGDKEFDRVNSETGLEFYMVGRIAAQYNKLWVQGDVFSGQVGSVFSYTSQIGNIEKEFVNIKISGTIPRLVFGYSVWEKSIEDYFSVEVIPYAGFRYTSFHLQSDVFDSTNVIDVRPNWFDPLIGMYVPISYKRFRVEVQADFGTKGNNHSWGISNRYRYRISKLVDVQLGWNLIRLYHDGNVRDETLESRIRLFGPKAGVGFRF